MRRIQLIFACLIMISPLMADSWAPRLPLAFASEGGSDMFFTMIPPRYGKDHKLQKEASGVAYKVEANGELKALYRTEGWYSVQVFVSRDGRYLVRMGPWNVGTGPAKADLAVAFYKDGKLLKQYSTADLVKDTSKAIQTTSHYIWQAPSPFDEAVTDLDRLKLRLHLDYKNVFQLHTIDGWTYSFDATSGKIKARTRTKR